MSNKDQVIFNVTHVLAWLMYLVKRSMFIVYSLYYVVQQLFSNTAVKSRVVFVISYAIYGEKCKTIQYNAIQYNRVNITDYRLAMQTLPIWLHCKHRSSGGLVQI